MMNTLKFKRFERYTDHYKKQNAEKKQLIRSKTLKRAKVIKERENKIANEKP